MTTAAHEQWRPTLLLTRSFIAEYVRNPVNLIMLVLVPLVFVLVAAGSIADAMQLLRGRPGMATQIVTAGWAAGFLSGLAMYFQICSARAADKRLLLAGLPPTRLLAARAGTGLLMAALVSARAASSRTAGNPASSIRLSAARAERIWKYIASPDRNPAAQPAVAVWVARPGRPRSNCIASAIEPAATNTNTTGTRTSMIRFTGLRT